MMKRWRRPLVISLLLLAAAVPAIAHTGAAVAAGPAGVTVIDGDARFEVLSPTLIRLEYAGDAAFQDATDVQRGQPRLPGRDLHDRRQRRRLPRDPHQRADAALQGGQRAVHAGEPVRRWSRAPA